MAFAVRSRSIRFQQDMEKAEESSWMCGARSQNKICPDAAAATKPCKSFKQKVLSRVFSEDYDSLIGSEMWLFDPHSSIIQRWNKIFLVACLVSLFLDPLFFYIPETKSMACIDIGARLELALTVLRSVADVFYAIHILVRFRTAFVAPSSRVFGRGELVVDPSKIASRYLLSGSFWLDLVAALPLPQLLIWFVIPSLGGSAVTNTNNFLRFSIIIQYLPRLFLILPLSMRIVRMTGVMTENAWAGAAYNLLLYMLASHVIGASWYVLSIERQEACWREVCRFVDVASCQYGYFDCRLINSRIDNLTKFCNPSNDMYQFGIYADAVNFKVTSSPFIPKFFYCFWWGLKNLSCLGQNLSTTINVGEISFAIIIAVVGLVLFGLLIGNMQSYLESTTARLEEWRVKRTDTEQWMRHRQLPSELQQCVRRYQQSKWVATRGVDEEVLLEALPADLRRDIKRHLCLNLVRRVPLFAEMADGRMLDAICERLRPALYTPGTCLVRELDPVGEMLFVIRGRLDSATTNGGRSGFFNSCRIGPGEFCGEELLTWALDPRPTAALPLSTRTARAVTEVEAFALVAEDLKFVASRFRRLHSRQLRHKFRSYSHQWRTWAACFIQAAWRRQKRRRASMELRFMESGAVADMITAEAGGGRDVFGAAAKKGELTGAKRKDSGALGKAALKLKKPKEPDFSIVEEES